ncbi:MAG: glycoside hydrolase family 9 protein [Bacteroidota bacterium]
MRHLLLFSLACLLFACEEASLPDASDGIYLNQVGYYPGTTARFSVLTAMVIQADSLPATAPALATTYRLLRLPGKEEIATGPLGEEQDWTELAGVKVRYTEFTAPKSGMYQIEVPDYGLSHPFTVADNIYREALAASLKSNYYQRASTELLPAHAGKWARPAAHPDTAALYHPSSGRTEGIRSSAGGWYDAGDFNKYIVNAAFPMGQYLALYEDVGDPLPDGTLNIPESGNGTSDYLDELRYELDWMLTMQDDDGGLFHKLTTLNFEGMVMPHEATNQRYVVGKSTEATLNFAGAVAQAARVFRPLDGAYAQRLETAARYAWAWAQANPEQGFKNPEDVHTGQYGDTDWYDEGTFAAAELFCTTGEQEFLNALQREPPDLSDYRAGEGWRNFMGKMGVFSLLRHPDRVPKEMYDELVDGVIGLADSLVIETQRTAYRQPLQEFKWGSTSDVLNAGLVLAAAYQQKPKPAYLETIRAGMDYLFGHNPLGYSYVTGFGTRTPMFIHHRQSAADTVAQPIPGFLSGGANSGQQDKEYTFYTDGVAPMQSWADQTPSYASNEICLNWNAPLTYMLGWLEAQN